ncbi:ABC transporter ATP-binding protein [Corticibacter populi]|uniref:ABC transporter ATP-binding protein n=1 Tax=Corticibacter populi TaxID=1550736 RepID=A0A3M6R127_9BURK|nr:ABC transporter ATP-binding protein [Corticibacter populi]RMX08432.1 ABC transporter ATP-binding protein [Corticibacter populi]RZS35739.1 iron(III) transport system ATP-binding protein [Corticibacter populi]
MKDFSSQSAAGVSVTVQALGRRFGDFQALAGVDFALPPGRVLALLGPSGCGKSTLLKLLAGLDRPSAGSIHFDGRLVASASVCEPPQKRRLGMVFQDYALWPHMSVQDNIAFALQMQRIEPREIDARVGQVLERVGLVGLGSRTPAALSGGQQQRVALARAIVAQPALLLFDEPLSNLDRDLRESLCTDIAELLRELGTTAVYVTHDHEEACAMADEVAVMLRGRIAQRTSPQTLWSEPASLEVARFLKLGALVDARCDADGMHMRAQSIDGQPARLPWPLSMAQQTGANRRPGAGATGSPGLLLVPQTAIRLQDAGSAPLAAQVVAQQYSGGGFRTQLELSSGERLQTTVRERLQLRAGMVGLCLDPAQLRWFAADDRP